MTEGVDYSFARPGAACLADSGKRFAVRYIGTPSSGKNLSPVEAGRLKAAGLDLVAVYQTTAGFMTEGASGSQAAQRAHDDAVRCGMPPDRPIYFALDMDPASVTASGWLSVERFLADAARVLGEHRTGVYGGWAAIERLVPDHCRYGWQTYAWSRGRVSAKAHLLQYRNGVTLCGGAVDLCRSLKPDFGQWAGSTTEDDDMPYSKDELHELVKAAVGNAFEDQQATARKELNELAHWIVDEAAKAAAEAVAAIAVPNFVKGDGSTNPLPDAIGWDHHASYNAAHFAGAPGFDLVGSEPESSGE